MPFQSMVIGQRSLVTVTGCTRLSIRSPSCSYPQGRLCRPEDCFFTQRSLPRGSEKAFLALFAPGNSAEFQQKAFLISVAFFLKT
jgi:hypothetical protein